MDGLDRQAIRHCQRFAQLSGLAAAGIAGMAMLGWAVGAPVLASLGTGGGTMKPATALCLVILGTLLARSAAEPGVAQERRYDGAWLTWAGCGIVLAVSLTMLAEDAFDLDTGIDRLLLSGALVADTDAHAGRMAPLTAVSLALLGSALLADARARARGAAEALALPTIAIGLVACLGYLYRFTAFYGQAPYAAMALPTALAIMGLGIGTLVAHPYGPLLRPLLSRRGGGAMVRCVLLPALLLCVASSALLFVGESEGLYGNRLGLALFVVANPILLVAILWTAAVSFNRRDRASEEATGALQASEHQIRKLTESLPMLIWTAQPDGSCDFLSPQWVRYLGAPLESYLGFGWLERVHPVDRDNVMQAWSRALLSGNDYYCEFRVLRHDDVYRWFDGRAVARRSADGTIVKWYGTNVDIHEARSMQETLRQHAMLIELAHDPIFAWSPNDGITFWNRGCERLYGYTKHQALGRHSHELLRTIYPESRERFALELERDGRWDGELRQTTKSGRERILSSRHQRIELDGKLVVLEADRDITEERRAEELLRRAQRMEALGALSGGIAHDFNNIIAAIQGNTNLAIADLAPDHPAQESLCEVSRAARRAAELVRQILIFSQQKPAEQVRVELQPVVEEVLGLLRSLLPPLLDLRQDLRGERRCVLGDATQIHQVIMNLVTNAAHAIGERAGRIDIGLEAVRIAPGHCHAGADLPEGAYLRLSVRDDGCGMDAATLDRAFEPFFTSKPVGEGTGLGLAVVHGIVKSHGGALRVQSEPGQGSTFQVYLPEAVQEAATAESAAEAALPHGRGERLLYVDDEDALVFLATRLLGRLGYTVEGYTDPVEALRAFRERSGEFDAAITDLSMAAMSGMDFARELLRIRPDLPVVMLTGHLRPNVLQTARRHGVLDVVLKPSAVEGFAELVQRALRAPRRNA